MTSGIQINPEQLDAMKRGGRPTLEEMSQHLMFNPLDAVIELSDSRMILQRASLISDLRDTLEKQHGTQAAKVTLMRIGFRTGVADAQFIRSAWPNISLGDAFTAGVRLHMLSGIVNVETLGNDFDFSRDRFSGEFLWHNSVEATEYLKARWQSAEPVCWTQLGYASGYASDFFSKLVIYKELECIGMGHKACRIKGGTVDRWGEDDPMVKLFKEEIVPGSPQFGKKQQASVKVKTEPPKSCNLVDQLLISPRLQRLIDVGHPILITGPQGSGRRRMARHVHSQRAPAAQLRLIHCASPTIEDDLSELFASSNRHLDFWLLEAVEDLPCHLQVHLTEALTAEQAGTPVHIVGLSTENPANGGLQSISPELRFAFAPVVLPPLNIRDDRIDLAKALVVELAKELDVFAPDLGEASKTSILENAWPGNLPELEAALREALLTEQVSEIGTLTSNKPAQSTSLETELAKALDQGPLDLDGIMNRLCHLAWDRAGHNTSLAARSLGLTRAQLAYRLKSREDTAYTER